jgi:hypothetical protein
LLFSHFPVLLVEERLSPGASTGTKRTDEMAADPPYQVVVTNASDTVPLATPISVTQRVNLSKLGFANGGGGFRVRPTDAVLFECKNLPSFSEEAFVDTWLAGVTGGAVSS